MNRGMELLRNCHPEARSVSEGRLYSIMSFPKFHPGEDVEFATKRMGGTSLTLPPSDVGNLNIYRSPTENFGDDKCITAFRLLKKRVRSTSFYFHHNIVLVSLFLFFFLISCGGKLPEEITPGEHKCEFCKMGVVNQNYHSQVLTKKGRRYHFDSIECMFSFWNSNLDKVDKVWVKDYLHPKDWIEIQNAKFLRADKLPSPMAANLSSYKSEKEAEDNRVLYGGILMTQEEVMEYVKSNWEKELSGK